jgi:hypothetical protein
VESSVDGKNDAELVALGKWLGGEGFEGPQAR